jgi:hypothetical protein
MTQSPDQDPAAALDAVRQARRATLGQMAHGSLAYDLIYAALVGGVVASLALPRSLSTFGTVACAMGLIVLMRVWANRTGVWVGGLHPRRARWVAIGLGGILVVLVLAAFGLREKGLWPLAAALGPVASLAAFVASRLWMKVYRAETGVGA